MPGSDTTSPADDDTQIHTAKLIIDISPTNPRPTENTVEVDIALWAHEARTTEVLADAGWRITLSFEHPRVKLIARKPHPSISSVAKELSQLGLQHVIYWDEPGPPEG